jgi:hypothetical protein
MFAYLRDNAEKSDRKMLLFSVACCRRKMLDAPVASQERHRRAIETIERHADGLATAKQMYQACNEIPTRDGGRRSQLVLAVGRFGGGVGARLAADHLADGGTLSPLACHFIRDVVGNPFRPVPVTSAWLTPTVLSLAQATYVYRGVPAGTLDSTRLAALADALEEAGCDNADILSHLRQPGEHVRGCWVVDLLLGKE